MKVKTTRNPQGAPAATAHAAAATPPATAGPDDALAAAQAEGELEAERLAKAQAGEALVLPLFGGKTVTMQRPKAVYTLLLYRLLGEDARSEALDAIYRGIFHVTAVDGNPVVLPQTSAQVDFVAGLLGDQGIEDVAMYFMKYFAPRVEVIRPL